MVSERPDTKPIVEPDAAAVEQQYGELGSVYAETRSAVAKSLGREDAAREWRDVTLETEDDGETARER